MVWRSSLHSQIVVLHSEILMKEESSSACFFLGDWSCCFCRSICPAYAFVPVWQVQRSVWNWSQNYLSTLEDTLVHVPSIPNTRCSRQCIFLSYTFLHSYTITNLFLLTFQILTGSNCKGKSNCGHLLDC